MFSGDKITEIFCLADDFCKFFDSQVKKNIDRSQSGSENKRKYHRGLTMSGISFVDSTPLRVCKNQRIHIRKVFKEIA